MRYALLGLTLISASAPADRSSDRDALLAADQSLSQKTATAGLVEGFVPALADDALFLYPGAQLLRGSSQIRAFLASSDSLLKPTWSAAFADVSADGRLGYSFGWTKQEGGRGKYLACWKKSGGTWRLAAYAVTRPSAVSDSSTPVLSQSALSRQVKGRSDPHEVLQADSAFAALSVASGAQTAFLAYAADNAISFGGGAEITQGRAAIGANFNGFPAGAVLEWRPVAAQIAPSGDLGCTVGEARISSLNHYSKYLTIWRRQADKSWKFVADGGNVRPAPAASGSPPPED